MIKTGISPDCVQDLFDSASNAAQKGQAQYFTPPEITEHLRLPAIRNTICDLTAGDGSLLVGTANETTLHLIGAEIQGLPAPKLKGAKSSIVTADITALYPLLTEVDWQCDLFVLNPPWDLHWHRERLAHLAESSVLAVREAFGARDPRLAASEIDSTIATLLIALDRCTQRGEGVLIANAATMDRLVFGERAPHAALTAHIWRVDTLKSQKWAGGADVAVIHFARDHETGPGSSVGRSARDGLSVDSKWHTHDKSIELWTTVAEEWRNQVAARSSGRPAYHLSLSWDGTVAVHLSQFASASRKTNKALAAELIGLRGQKPMQLVVTRSTRGILLRALEHWTVQPELKAAVDQAVAEYHAERAPLYPLPKVQRLGYLEEEDSIRCEKDLGPFKAGKTYPITTETVEVTRKSFRMNLIGDEEEMEFTGYQLVTHVLSDHEDHVFVDGSCLADGVTTTLKHPASLTHVLQDLLEHFHIPEVPDVVAAKPQQYQKHLATLLEIEQAIAS